MEKWISVAPETVQASQLETVRGIQVQVFASPHDVPVAVRGAFEEGCDRFVISLKYVDQDDSDLMPEQSEDGVITIFKGRLSGRVERIEVHTKKRNASAVALNIVVPRSTSLIEKVEERLQQLRTSQESLASRLNYAAVSEALEQSKDLLAAI